MATPKDPNLYIFLFGRCFSDQLLSFEVLPLNQLNTKSLQIKTFINQIYMIISSFNNKGNSCDGDSCCNRMDVLLHILLLHNLQIFHQIHMDYENRLDAPKNRGGGNGECFRTNKESY